ALLLEFALPRERRGRLRGAVAAAMKRCLIFSRAWGFVKFEFYFSPMSHVPRQCPAPRGAADRSATACARHPRLEEGARPYARGNRPPPETLGRLAEPGRARPVGALARRPQGFRRTVRRAAQPVLRP